MKMQLSKQLGNKDTQVPYVYKNYSSLPFPHLYLTQIVTVLEDEGVWPVKKQSGKYISVGSKWVRI